MYNSSLHFVSFFFSISVIIIYYYDIHMDDFLKELKVDRNPVVKRNVQIKFPTQNKAIIPQAEITTMNPEVVQHVKIIDESKNSNDIFNRDDFLKRIKNIKIVNQINASDIIPVKGANIPGELPIQEPMPGLEPVPPAIPKTLEPAPSKKNKTIKIKPPSFALDTILPPKPQNTTRKKRLIIRPSNPPTVDPISTRTDALDTTIDQIKNMAKDLNASIVVPASSYYMNNREIFINSVNVLFKPYKETLDKEARTIGSCERRDDNRSLMTHQYIVRDYLNMYTPYRGLLLFHGLGSGKTCSSISIAEGFKSTKRIIVMTPKSLRMNFREELKKCGDELYGKKYNWSFINSSTSPKTSSELAKILSLPIDFINAAKGAWLVDTKKEANYDTLSNDEQISLTKQINVMIDNKYEFINYNGLRKKKLTEMTKNGKNIFDNTVVIIDEAHNLISRIVNKLTIKGTTISGTLYSLLTKAHNAKIILLTGTPIINSPNEISVLFNILRGDITTWTIPVNITSHIKTVDADFFKTIFATNPITHSVMDVIDYKANITTLTITRNPFGFINKYTPDLKKSYLGVIMDEGGNVADAIFLDSIKTVLERNGIQIGPMGIKKETYKSLPDSIEEFNAKFIGTGGILQEPNLFKRRILGLTSYFHSAQEGMMPRYTEENNLKIVKIPMSDFQFAIYETARAGERKIDKGRHKKNKNKKPNDELYIESSSTYRIFSRAFCNFVFPEPILVRPMPGPHSKTGENKTTEINEDDIDGITSDERMERDDTLYEAEELEKLNVDDAVSSYSLRIQQALNDLFLRRKEFLEPAKLATYSPKFLEILNNLSDKNNSGIHLIYSQFRALEGIGILKLVLETNGFAQFKIKQSNTHGWELDIKGEDLKKPMFALYTGTETDEVREITRNAINNAWSMLPSYLESQIRKIWATNINGEMIKALMITSSGAEGISLKNVRFVHICEPYWHPVRIEQVIGRARRICSHQDLPESQRTVDVFIYLMVFTPEQISGDKAIETRISDKSKINPDTVVTTDEHLYEIAQLKAKISSSILKAVKESSIDCALHVGSNKTEKIQCFAFGSNNNTKISYMPSFDTEQSDAAFSQNTTKVTWTGQAYKHEGVIYILNKNTGELFDAEYLKTKPPQFVKRGDIITKTNGEETVKLLGQ